MFWQYSIIFISLGMVFLSFYCMAYPDRLIDTLPKLSKQPIATYCDIFVRVLLVVSLVFAAKAAIYPMLFSVLGYFSIIAALSIVILGRRKIELIVCYISNVLPVWFVRLICGLGALFFSFLVYATNIQTF